jgi:hypothetical protein
MRIKLIWSDYNIEKSLNHQRLPKGHCQFNVKNLAGFGSDFSGNQQALKDIANRRPMK